MGVFKMEAVKIVLTCPNCGNSTWIERADEDYMFECLACGDLVYPEDMGSKMEKHIKE